MSEDLTFSEYQENAKRTALYPGRFSLKGLIYTVLGMNGEAGEAAEQVKKSWRDEGRLTAERREKLIKEIGDVLWYCALTADEIGISLAEIARINNEKLADRFERNKIHGSGDER